ncbi:putative choline transport protein [Lineolata rhizophorae]|uniref:Putative choline transport protein n=1 Tax=Lineolata rhizophorae TaxID=578093 RepID=A0A6A6NP16_9PEZI|nr:putative choline transport protein [Lineolata rhizophorae]
MSPKPSTEEKRVRKEEGLPSYDAEDVHAGTGQVINASGHVQELDRNFSLLSVTAVGITTGNVWAALGGSIVVAIYNGGAAGVLYEFIVVSVFYWGIAACLAELASAIPSAAGVYHWASVTAGSYGRSVGWFAGWWNYFAWIFGGASMSSILANQLVSMWALFHPDYVQERWHVFVTYLIMTWICCCTVLFFNELLPKLQSLGLYFILIGVFVTIMVCAIMPSTTGSGHASSRFVFADWENQTGWSSDGFVFLAGMLNGAYAVGTPDCVSHLAEELPKPRINIPKAVLMQYIAGFVTAFCYIIALFYSITDLDAVFNSPFSFPLAEIYRQATGSRGGSLGLLIVIFLPTVFTCMGTYITSGRMLWTLARDDATPFSGWMGTVSKRWHNPWNATLVCGGVCTVMGCIYVGSTTAFNAFVGSFVVLTTLSYLAAIMPHMLTRRATVVPGPFWMPNPVAYPVMFLSCGYIMMSVIIYCFPYAKPFDAQSMNYSCVITGGLTIIVGAWWLYKRTRGYVGPKALLDEERRLSIGIRGGRISSDKE